MRRVVLQAAATGAIVLGTLGVRQIPSHDRVPAQGVSGVSTNSIARRVQAPPATGRKAECKGNCADEFEDDSTQAQLQANLALNQSICGFLSEFLGRAVKPNPSSEYCPSVNAVSGDHKWKVIVAILPDPVHTHLALRYDRSIDALQNSAQDLGWTFDRSWMPWDGKVHAEPDRFFERLADDVSSRGYQKAPGVILFRGNQKLQSDVPSNDNEEPQQPLIVLTVGDTPTRGVNADQFREAINVWKKLIGWDAYFRGAASPEGNSVPHLQILGPTFSGSVPSLDQLLAEITASARAEPIAAADKYLCPSKPLRISVSSGTINNSDGLSLLNSQTVGCDTLQVSAVSFGVDLTYEIDHALGFLKHHDFHGGVALLSEEESSFGDIFGKFGTHRRETELGQGKELVRTLRSRQLSSPQKMKVDDLETRIKEELNHVDAEKKLIEAFHPYYFGFPREISHLRKAYEQSGILGFGSDPNASRTQLHLSLSGDTSGEDTVQSFAGMQNAVAMEAQMALLATTLEAKGVRVALVSATDVLDEIFVTRYLAQHAPNVTVIVTDTDGLFLRSGDDTSMHDTFVIGPWPLIPENEWWSARPGSKNGSEDEVAADVNGHDKPRIHSSAGGQGFYSATRYLACEGDSSDTKVDRSSYCNSKMNEFPPLKLSLREYQPPIATESAITNDLKTEPPIWLSVIGHGRFWPISLVDIDQKFDYLPKSSPYNLPSILVKSKLDGQEVPLPAIVASGIKVNVTAATKIVTAILALMLLWHAAACFRCRLDRAFAWNYALSDPEHRTVRLAVRILLSLSAIPALQLLRPPSDPTAGVNLFESAGKVFSYSALNYTLRGVALVLAVWPAWLLFRALRENWQKSWKNNRTHLSQFLIAVFVLPGMFLFVTFHLWHLISPSAPSERAFFYYRSANILSGSSPVLPLLLLVLALACSLWNRFARLVFYRHRIPVLPTAPAELRCPSPERVKPVNRLFSYEFHWRRIVITIACLSTCILIPLLVPQLIPRSLMHGALDFWISGLSIVVLGLILNDLCMALLGWFLLRTDCLIPLGQSPLRWGFTWIKGFSWQRLCTPGAMSPDRVFEYLTRLSESNRRALLDVSLQDAFTELRSAANESPKKEQWAAKVTAKVGVVHTVLARSATAKLVDLQRLWSTDHGPITGHSDSVERGLGDERLVTDLSGDERQAALNRMAHEEFVALLYLGYIRLVLLQIRNRVMTATGMYVLLLWSLTSYPFLNHHSLLIFLSFLLFVVASVVIVIYAQMHRDDILSRTTETTSGKLDTDFYLKTVPMIGLPLLTLIASQFPEISNLVFSWLQPSLASVK